jgi:hypothetical protein
VTFGGYTSGVFLYAFTLKLKKGLLYNKRATDDVDDEHANANA